MLKLHNVSDRINDLKAGKFNALTVAPELGTPVQLPRLNVDGVISGFNPNDSNRVRVSWFNRHFWRVDHKWVDLDTVVVCLEWQL